MKIYICLPRKIIIDSSTQKDLRGKLCSGLKKYYGKFSVLDIEFSKTRGNNIIVNIMNEPLRSYYDDKIVRVIREIISSDAIINLHNKDFTPLDEDIGEIERLSHNYHAEEPRYTLEQVILPEDTLNRIKEAANMSKHEVRKIVFEDWGLRNIVPHAASAMNFYGNPGTGKTMAAEAVAKYLKKKIIRASYADIESKYHGEGPKMVKAIFMAAARDDAVLFIDESDSLLSKRLTNVTDGSAQAINSMRSQLLISIEQFNGVVIFATNLVINYDKAFISRLRSIEFPMPDLNARKQIWQKHLYGNNINIPLDDSVNIDELAEKYNFFCGREIKNAVVNACVSKALEITSKEDNNLYISKDDLIKACEKVIEELKKLLASSDHTDSRKILFTEEENKSIARTAQREFDKIREKS